MVTPWELTRGKGETKMSNKLKWSRDGDQWVANGRKGEYRITCWITRWGDEYHITLTFPNEERAALMELNKLVLAKDYARRWDAA
jgi:hypothetical protein